MYIVSYDVGNDRIRGKIAKELENYGKRVQYSVFECRISEKQLEKLYGSLAALIQQGGEGNIRVYLKELLSCYRKVMIQEDSEIFLELMQVYTDLHDFAKASFFMEKKEAFDNFQKPGCMKTDFHRDLEEDVICDAATAGKILRVFAGREDIYKIEGAGYGNLQENYAAV